MTEPDRHDWRLLGVNPEADLADIEAAYRDKRSLYGGDNLATYSLLSDEELDRHLKRLDAAYTRIVQSRTAATRPQPRAREIDIDGAASEAPSPTVEPAAHLRYWRERHRLELAQVADEIKVRETTLRAIEEQCYELLPAPVYVRGFIIQYARSLRLPGAELLAAAYLERMEDAT